jgi:hypothetical protein
VKIHPELRALRSDDTPQREAQLAVARWVDAWRSNPRCAAVLSDFDRFAQAAPLAECPLLAALFDAEDQAAAQFAGGCMAALTQELMQAPLAHVPMRHFYDGTMATLLLAQSGDATLALCAIDGASLRQRPQPRAIRLAPVDTWEHVLAGSAAAQRFSAGADFRHEQVVLEPGTFTARNELRQAQLITEVTGTLVTLRLQRRHRSSEPAREYDRETGVLLHQTASNPQDSRHEMMLALLGRMQRADAAPVMAAMAMEPGSTALRWQSLRECLALDTAAGFASLTKVASSLDDPLAVPAGALRAQLIESYPQLKALEPCPM